MNPTDLIELRCAEFGIPATDEEKQRWAARYADRRADMAALYTLPEVKYEDLAVVFRPTS